MSSIVYLHCHQNSRKKILCIILSLLSLLESQAMATALSLLAAMVFNILPFISKIKVDICCHFSRVWKLVLRPTDKSIHHCGMNRAKVSMQRSNMIAIQLLLVFPGKIFPKLYRRTEQQSSVTSTDEEAGEAPQVDRTEEEMASPTGDYVFRIVFLADRQFLMLYTVLWAVRVCFHCSVAMQNVGLSGLSGLWTRSASVIQYSHTQNQLDLCLHGSVF